MAKEKKARVKKTENIKKKQVDYLEFLKVLTKWIINTRRNEDQLVDIINRYKIDNNIAKRILSYCYSFPHIIYYFNRYMNNRFSFESYDTRVLIKSIVYLMDINNRNNSKFFLFIKSNELKDEVKHVILGLIKEYLQVTYNIFCNRRDLGIYYKLFKLGVIKDEDLLSIDKLLNDKDTVIKSLNFINFQEASSVEDLNEDPEKENELAPSIVNFISSIKDEKIMREECKSCVLFNKPIVVLDTNVKDFEQVDIAFLGLNPGTDEVKADKPFVGDSGKHVRRIIDKLPENTKWVILNALLCNTSNKKEIEDLGGNIYEMMKNCYGLTGQIVEKFKPKIFVPFGDDAKLLFGLNDKITTVSGKVFELETGEKIIPIVHPSSILRNSKFQAIFDSSVKNLLNLFGVKEEVQKQTVKKIDDSQLVSDTKDLLLVDVKRIENNQILMIYTDLAGNKKYQIKDYQFPILIRNKDWKECNMTTDKVDDSCVVNDYQRSMISKKCHQILKEMVTI
jgi:uracil-DNA glycosylase family 4